MYEVKHTMKWQYVKKTEDGYWIDYIPAKQRGPVVSSKLLIPRIPKGSNSEVVGK